MTTREACARCAERRPTCPSCVQRRRRAWSLVVERGEAPGTPASVRGLSSESVEELVVAEQDRRELPSPRCDSIPVHRTQTVFAAALTRDPDLTIADLARWMEMTQPDFERVLWGRDRRTSAQYL